MANFTVLNMAYVTSGAGRSRIPREPVPTPGNPPGLINLVPPKVMDAGITTGTFSSYSPQPSYTVGGVTYYYAFTSMSGGTDGGDTTNVITDTLQQTLASPPVDLVQLNVYIQKGGYGPGGGPGAIIDAFDETTGSFVNDIFVSVSPDDGAGDITHEANYLGAFGTAGNTEVVTAYSSLSAEIGNFDKWMIMPGTGDDSDTINNKALTVGQNSNVIAFAYYNNPAPKFKDKEEIKDLKDNKDIKEYSKEYKEKEKGHHLVDKVPGMKENESKDYYKDWLDKVRDNYSKQIYDKYSYSNKGEEGTTSGGSYPQANQYIEAIITRVAGLESKITELGNAFIKAQNRPEVAKEMAKNIKKRK